MTGPRPWQRTAQPTFITCTPSELQAVASRRPIFASVSLACVHVELRVSASIQSGNGLYIDSVIRSRPRDHSIDQHSEREARMNHFVSPSMSNLLAKSWGPCSLAPSGLLLQYHQSTVIRICPVFELFSCFSLVLAVSSTERFTSSVALSDRGIGSSSGHSQTMHHRVNAGPRQCSSRRHCEESHTME
jgi:hypothetical protein